VCPYALDPAPPAAGGDAKCSGGGQTTDYTELNVNRNKCVRRVTRPVFIAGSRGQYSAGPPLPVPSHCGVHQRLDSSLFNPLSATFRHFPPLSATFSPLNLKPPCVLVTTPIIPLGGSQVEVLDAHVKLRC